jgi:hypothetical protein
VLMLRGIAICARLDASALKSFFELGDVWVEYITSFRGDEAVWPASTFAVRCACLRSVVLHKLRLGHTASPVRRVRNDSGREVVVGAGFV